MLRTACLILMAVALAACTGPSREQPATGILTPSATQAAPPAPTGDYRIGPNDTLNVTVFQVPDLSVNGVRVDTAGNIQLPLIGTVPAAGRTASELSEAVRQALASSYLQNPQVTVAIAEAASQKVTIDGAVTTPGVFELRGRTTLLQAVAMARGPTPTADLTSVAVFRTIEGQRMVAVFDLRAIRLGEAQDPEILGDDVVVVDSSRLNTTLQSVITSLPALAIFRPF